MKSRKPNSKRYGRRALAAFVFAALAFWVVAGAAPSRTGGMPMENFTEMALAEQNSFVTQFPRAGEEPAGFPLPATQPDTQPGFETPEIPIEPQEEDPFLLFPFLQSDAHNGADLPVQAISQLPALPNGCEATSLAILLQYLGYSVSKETIAYHYLPSRGFSSRNGVRYGCDPEEAYPGDPATTSGYYCYETPVVQAANDYLAEQGDTRKALSFAGASEDQLLSLLDAGVPLIVWKTIDNLAPRARADLTWRLYGSGESYAPLINVHVLVLRGYTETDFLLSDPLGREKSISRELFLSLYEQMGSRAVGIVEFVGEPIYTPPITV